MKNYKPDYGIDGSPKALVITVLIIAVIDACLYAFHGMYFTIAACIVLICGLWAALAGVWWIVYVKVGKFGHRDNLLSMVDWKGNETVLDVGTGRGLLMIGAAKRLAACSAPLAERAERSGKCIGIDVWRQQDMVNNNAEKTLNNARLEGVMDKIEIRNEDIRNTSFSSESFDVVLSNLCLHNISSKEGRSCACKEIARLMKPNGIAVISDGFHIREYRAIFEKEGMSAKIVKAKVSLGPGIKLHTVVAVKSPLTIARF